MTFLPPPLAHGTSPERMMKETLLRDMLKTANIFGKGDGGWADMAADVFAEVIARQLGSSASSEDGASAAPTSPNFPLRRDHGHGHAAGHVHAARSADAVALLGLVEGPARVSSSYGSRADPLTGAHKHHGGIDIAAPEGARVLAARGGRVVRAGPRGGYGNLVEVLHADGSRARYAHASRLLVEEGDTVRAGQPIAEVGQTGRATGPHLHFELRVGAQGHTTAIDPSHVLKAYAPRAEGKTKRSFPPAQTPTTKGGPHG